MRSKWLMIALFLSLAVNAGVLATTGYYYYRTTSPTSSAPCPMSPGDSHLYESLGLSKVQLSKMEPVAQKFHARLGELAALMEGKREALLNLLENDSNPESIEHLRKEMAGIQDEVQREVIAHIGEIKGILDPSQQQRLFSLMRQSMIQPKIS